MAGVIAEPVRTAPPTEPARELAIVPGRSPGRWPHRLSIMVLVGGLIVTAALSTVSRLNYLHSERRLVMSQTNLVADTLAVAPVDLQRRLGRAATVVAATGDIKQFETTISSSIPSPFASVELFRMLGGSPQLIDSLGAPAMLDPNSSQGIDITRAAVSSGTLGFTRIANATTQRFGYAMAVTLDGRTYVAYGEQIFPGNRRGELPPNSPVGNPDFAVYYGNTLAPSALVETNAKHLPLGGTAARATVPFGNGVITVVLRPRSPLLGTFAASLAWMIAIAGALLSIVMALLTERLVRRRAVAEQLAEVSGELYRAQHGVAETLQTSLLPQQLPQVPRLEIATRYLAGTEGTYVGGDWYDVVTLTDNRVFFTIGDVSGRGLSAATMMSRLRHTITAYAVEGHDPATVLTKVSAMVDLDRDSHFATVLCGTLDLDIGLAVIANAGHPPLVLITESTREPVSAPVGAPLGVGAQYRAAPIQLAPGAILLAYTDGLIERRGRSLEVGINELCSTARPTDNLEELLDSLLTLLDSSGATDDTAILGLRWQA